MDLHQIGLIVGYVVKILGLGLMGTFFWVELSFMAQRKEVLKGGANIEKQMANQRFRKIISLAAQSVSLFILAIGLVIGFKLPVLIKLAPSNILLSVVYAGLVFGVLGSHKKRVSEDKLEKEIQKHCEYK